jgi:hypothetical protein
MEIVLLLNIYSQLLIRNKIFRASFILYEKEKGKSTYIHLFNMTKIFYTRRQNNIRHWSMIVIYLSLLYIVYFYPWHLFFLRRVSNKKKLFLFFSPRSIKTVSFTIRKRPVNVVKTGHLWPYTVPIRSVFRP